MKAKATDHDDVVKLARAIVAKIRTEENEISARIDGAPQQMAHVVNAMNALAPELNSAAGFSDSYDVRIVRIEKNAKGLHLGASMSVGGKLNTRATFAVAPRADGRLIIIRSFERLASEGSSTEEVSDHRSLDSWKEVLIAWLASSFDIEMSTL